MIDDKNRLLIPSGVRKSLEPQRDGEGFYLTIGLDSRLWLYPELTYENLVSQFPPDLLPTDEQLMFNQLNFAMTSRLSLDKQGRVLLPDHMLKEAGMDREVVLNGAGDHLELWKPDEWASYRQELMARRSELAAKVRQAQQQLRQRTVTPPDKTVD